MCRRPQEGWEKGVQRREAYLLNQQLWSAVAVLLPNGLSKNGHTVNHCTCTQCAMGCCFVLQYVVGELAWYPNCISVPLMPNYGVAEEPKGMIHVRLYKIEGLKSQDFMSKSDAYVQFEVGRA